MQPKFGTVRTGEVNEHGDFNGQETTFYDNHEARKLEIQEHSEKIEDEKVIIERIFDLYQKQIRGEILGFLVDASIYDPRTFKVRRFKYTVIKQAKAA